MAFLWYNSSSSTSSSSATSPSTSCAACAASAASAFAFAFSSSSSSSSAGHHQNGVGNTHAALGPQDPYAIDPMFLTAYGQTQEEISMPVYLAQQEDHAAVESGVAGQDDQSLDAMMVDLFGESGLFDNTNEPTSMGGEETAVASSSAVSPDQCPAQMVAQTASTIPHFHKGKMLVLPPRSRIVNQVEVALPRAIQHVESSTLEQVTAPTVAGPSGVSQAVNAGSPGAPVASTSAAAPAVAKRSVGRPRTAPEDKKKPTMYRCRFCSRDNLCSSEGLRAHMSKEHQLHVPGTRLTSCTCGKLFGRKADYNKHTRGDKLFCDHRHDRSLLKFSFPAPVTREELADTFALPCFGPVANRLIMGREHLGGRGVPPPPTGAQRRQKKGAVRAAPAPAPSPPATSSSTPALTGFHVDNLAQLLQAHLASLAPPAVTQQQPLPPVAEMVANEVPVDPQNSLVVDEQPMLPTGGTIVADKTLPSAHMDLSADMALFPRLSRDPMMNWAIEFDLLVDLNAN